MNKFKNLINSYKFNINEQDQMADPGAAAGAEPEAPPAPLAPPAPQPDVGQQSIADITLATKLALHGEFELTPEDRAVLIQVVSADNINTVRELLNTIVSKYDVPDV